MAERKTFGQRQQQIATRFHSLRLPNMISMRFRRLSYVTGILHRFRPGMQAPILPPYNAPLSQHHDRQRRAAF